MASISDLSNPWRDILLGTPASFRGVTFHVERGNRISGRRIVVHEYPKRNEPYSEDMGRHARRFSFTGYLIYHPNNDYVADREDLRVALEDDGPGSLVHPVFCQGGMMAVVERYTMEESNDKGGYTQFEMSFVEAGSPGNVSNSENTAATSNNQASKSGESMANSMNNVASSYDESGFVNAYGSSSSYDEAGFESAFK